MTHAILALLLIDTVLGIVSGFTIQRMLHARRWQKLRYREFLLREAGGTPQ